MFRFQSLDDDCTLEEEEGPVEEEDEIDQFNDDTFGAGAIDDDWQEEHARLAELDGRVLGVVGGGGDVSTVPLPPAPRCIPPPSSLPPPGLEERGGGDLAESLARLILGADPAIAGVGAAGPDRVRLPPPAHQQPPPSTLPGPSHPLLGYQQHQHLLRRGTAPLQMNSHSIWENSMGFGPVSVTPGFGTHMEDSPLMSIIKDVGLPKRPPPIRSDESRDLSERPMSHVLNQQLHCPTAVHVRAPVQHRYPPPFPERLSPNTLLNIANSPLCRPPFSAGVGPVLSQIQRAQLLNSQTPTFNHNIC
ncbi:hypothetical protein SKAU_G00393030 [Synaphobranchus kaupii]|uniref:Uncharacterized protein n=1 Tax=Synaphobranchus kaupii TaxID=118154 RepID=A0A9Q1EBZ9_SYNKA|nr:hypothetical protein SKAU_G00393030 [Synaphobranchus kaupii]